MAKSSGSSSTGSSSSGRGYSASVGSSGSTSYFGRNLSGLVSSGYSQGSSMNSSYLGSSNSSYSPNQSRGYSPSSNLGYSKNSKNYSPNSPHTYSQVSKGYSQTARRYSAMSQDLLNKSIQNYLFGRSKPKTKESTKNPSYGNFLENLLYQQKDPLSELLPLQPTISDFSQCPICKRSTANCICKGYKSKNNLSNYFSRN